MSVDHWKELKELYKSSTINSSENISLQNFGGSSLCRNTEFLNGLNSNSIDICPSSFAICLAQFTRLFYSSLQLYLSNEPDVLLGDVNELYQIISQSIQQLQQEPVPPNTVPAMKPCFGANEDSKYDPDDPSEDIKDEGFLLPQPDNHEITNKHDLQDDFCGNANININEPAPFEEVKDEDLMIPQPDNDGIFYKLNEFVRDYNKPRDIAHQISGYAVTRCFMENIMDYTDFADLKTNLKRYGIPAGPVRKLWRFLNPEEENENEQDDENVVVIPIGFYMYMPGISDEISFETDDDDNNDEECVGFKIGDNLSVPSDWSDDDQ